MQVSRREPSKSSLSPGRQLLVSRMQHLNFGRMEELLVKNGEPVFDPPPLVVREVKFCAENGVRPESTRQDFSLKMQVLELFAQMEAMGDGTISSLEVKHGLPFKMAVQEGAA